MDVHNLKTGSGEDDPFVKWMIGYMSQFRFRTDVASAHISIRMAFLRKVYGILVAQLLTTTLVCAGFMLNAESVNAALRAGWFGTPIICGLALITAWLLYELHLKAHETPDNFVLLLAFTLCQSVTLGLFVVHFEAIAVFKALALTLLLTAGLTLFSLQSKRDFSSWEAPLFVGLLLLLGCLVMQLFLPSNAWQFLTSFGGIVLFGLYIVFDASNIMTKVSPEDYIRASIDLYLDIVNLFISILRCIAAPKKE